jgi:hypothetical protein
MEEPKKTVVMRKGDTYADIFDSPETIAQARREGYSLVDPEDIEKHGGDLESLTRNELLELIKQKGVFEKKHSTWNKPELIALLRPDDPENQGNGGKPPEGTEPPNPEAGEEPEQEGDGADKKKHGISGIGG